MKHFANPQFWKCYHGLPKEIQVQADKATTLFSDPFISTVALARWLWEAENQGAVSTAFAM
jgi:hypothetical protein